MAAEVGATDPELAKVLELNRKRRAELKLQILASLRVPTKAEEAPSTARGRRMTSEMVLLGMTNIGINLDVDISGLSLQDGLKLRFLHHLAKRREDTGVKEKQNVEIAKMREVHEKSRNDLKTLAAATRVARLKNRRIRRVLQALQSRLVASTLALQYQMQRKIELTHRLENINYYRDTILENAFAFLYGRSYETPVPLGGVFSPYTYVDYDDEEERIEKEYAYLMSLTPAVFKASAQSRRAAFRTMINDSIVLLARQSNGAGQSQSVEYASIAAMPSFSQTAGNPDGSVGAFPERRSGSEDAAAFASGMVTSTLIDPNLSPVHRSGVSKGLKPSLSDKPTKHEIAASSGKRPAGLFSIFKNK